MKKLRQLIKKPPKQPEPEETNLTKFKPPPAEEQWPKELSPIERYRLIGHF